METIASHLHKVGLLFDGAVFSPPDWARRIKIDVGLSDSASNSIEWIRKDSQLLVIGLEPIPESVATLQKKIRSEPDSAQILKQLRVIPVALGVNSQVSKLYVTKEDPSSSSLLEPSKMEVSRVIEVPVYTLFDLLAVIPFDYFDKVDHLKLDCQGADLEILASARHLLQRIAIVTAEAEDGQYLDSRNDLASMEGFMAGAGFVPFNTRSPVRVKVGKFLAHSAVVRRLKIRLPYRKPPIARSEALDIQVDDPTFINKYYLNEIRNGSISAYQKG